MLFLCNGISSSMLHDPNMKEIRYALSESEFIKLVQSGKFQSIIGHKDLANALSEITNFDIEYNRQAIRVNYDDCILLVSVDGRLPEHPTAVSYKGKLKYTFVRFEKQTQEDSSNSLAKINEIMEAC